jgi:hypothetical protein
MDLASAVFRTDAWAASQVHAVAADLIPWGREQWLAARHLPIEQQGPESLRVLRDYLVERGAEIRPRGLAYLVRTLDELQPVPDSWEPLTGATLSPCGTYRYTLTRTLPQHYAGPEALWIMLNPSTADATVDDPTIRRVLSFSDREGCGTVTVCNLFAFRATDPAALTQTFVDVVGPNNDDHLRAEIAKAELIVVGWGSHGDRVLPRVRRVAGLLRERRPVCLGVTKSGQPRHPLYVRADQPLVAWRLP